MASRSRSAQFANGIEMASRSWQTTADSTTDETPRQSQARAGMRFFRHMCICGGCIAALFFLLPVFDVYGSQIGASNDEDGHTYLADEDLHEGGQDENEDQAHNDEGHDDLGQEKHGNGAHENEEDDGPEEHRNDEEREHDEDGHEEHGRKEHVNDDQHKHDEDEHNNGGSEHIKDGRDEKMNDEMREHDKQGHEEQDVHEDGNTKNHLASSDGSDVPKSLVDSGASEQTRSGLNSSNSDGTPTHRVDGNATAEKRLLSSHSSASRGTPAFPPKHALCIHRMLA